MTKHFVELELDRKDLKDFEFIRNRILHSTLINRLPGLMKEMREYILSNSDLLQIPAVQELFYGFLNEDYVESGEDAIIPTFDHAFFLERLKSFDLKSMVKTIPEKAFVPHQLTGLPQRDQFEQDLKDHLVDVSDPKSPFSCVMIDLDNLKALNTAIGHQASDGVIKGFAALLVGAVGSRGRLYHRSGDEFYMLLHNTSGDEAFVFINRILSEVRHSKLHSSKGEQKITFSAGIASFPEHGKSAIELIHRIEGAMKISKSSGRDRATLFSGKL